MTQQLELTWPSTRSAPAPSRIINGGYHWHERSKPIVFTNEEATPWEKCTTDKVRIAYKRFWKERNMLPPSVSRACIE
jgi:hypothetical protein